MGKDDDDPQERRRVYSKIAPLILAYHEAHAGQRFHAEDLRQFVLHHEPAVAPASPDRILRELRLTGKLDYVVINRRKSLYQFRQPGTPPSAGPEPRDDDDDDDGYIPGAWWGKRI